VNSSRNLTLLLMDQLTKEVCVPFRSTTLLQTMAFAGHAHLHIGIVCVVVALLMVFLIMVIVSVPH
ncbi:hypothetical protein XENORESO_010537, partial [Xenotaenia resolanae]